MNFHWIIPLLIGAVIGYVTNDIAIKMLFHPRKAYYIGKWRIPFTPGLIPKEKDRVARSIGKVISTQLLNSEVVTETLTSDTMIAKLQEKLEQLVDSNRDNTDTVRDVLERAAGTERAQELLDKLKENASEVIYYKLMNIHFGEKLSRIVLKKMKENLNSSIMMFMGSIFDEMSEGIGDMIDHVVADNSEDIIREIIDKEVDKIEDTMICDLIEKYEDRLPKYMDLIIEAYKKAVTDHMKDILEGINLAKIVEDRVTSFDVVQLENMIFGIMDRELKAIVYLGALLGCLMGIVNIII